MHCRPLRQPVRPDWERHAYRHSRRGTASDGHWPSSGDAEAARSSRHEDRPVRCDRIERSVCIAGSRGVPMLGIADDDERVNPNGGAIGLGRPLGMSGARFMTTASYQLEQTRGRFALSTMCIGVDQSIAIALERL